MDQNKTELIPVPLPTEIPTPPSMDQLPLDILHSATVEMLIQQNDDLSSRLKVNIRRNSQQEQKILELKQELINFERRNENLQAQNQIVKEKEHIWTRQKEEQNRKVEATTKEMDLLQLRYNELYTTSKQRQKELYSQVSEKNNIISALEKKILTFHRIRSRAKDRLRTFLLQTAQSIHHKQNASAKVLQQNQMLKYQFEKLSNEVTQQESNFRENLEEIKTLSEKKITELTERISQLNETIKVSDTKFIDLKKETDDLLTQLREEQKGRARISTLSKEVGELKNESLTSKRKYIDIIKQLEQTRSFDLEKINQLKSTNKDTLKQLNEQTSSLKMCEEKLIELSQDNKDLSSQLESLQNLWIEAQNKLEKEQLKRSTLEKINKELSRDKSESKVVKSIERSQPSDKSQSKETTGSINSKLTEVYASQYSPITRDRPAEL